MNIILSIKNCCWKYLPNLKFRRGARCAAIEYFEWTLLQKLLAKHKKTMHNVFNLTIFLDVGARKGNS
jgi:hypothetical protein